jgi:hypothetical protein
VIPRCLPGLDTRSASALIASWVFALFAAAAWTRRDVTSLLPLDPWARTVLRRGTRATWVIWATLTTSHVLFWLDELELAPSLLAPVALLIATRWIRSELGVWCAALAGCALAALAVPALLSAVALMTAVTLALRALRAPILLLPPEIVAGPCTPYRVAEGGPVPTGEPHSAPVLAFTRAAPAAFARLLVGSVSGAYLALWTLGWQGGMWPEHALALDALLVLGLLLLASRARFRIAVVPLIADLVHLGVERDLLSAPDTAVEWGVTWVASGFGLLLASLLVTWRLRKSTDHPQWSSTHPPAR